MRSRSGLLVSLILLSLAYAGDGVPPRGSATDYPANLTAGPIGIGVACVSASTAKQIFGVDLNRYGYLVFEVGFFPLNGGQADVSTADFRLSQGSDPNTVRALTPHDIASSIYPPKSTKPATPSKVAVRSSETIGYSTGGPARGGGVYTASTVGVGVGHDPNEPPPPPPDRSMDTLEQKLENQSLPEGLTSREVAGYVFFPKPSKDRRGAYSLLYLGKAGQGTLKLSPPAH